MRVCNEKIKENVVHPSLPGMLQQPKASFSVSTFVSLMVNGSSGFATFTLEKVIERNCSDFSTPDGSLVWTDFISQVQAFSWSSE